MRGIPPDSIDTNRHTGNGGPEDDGEIQPKLAPLPPRAFSRRPHGDPLSFPETAGGDNNPLTEAGIHSVKSVVVQESLSSRFHGESSVFALTNTLCEKWKFTSMHDLQSRRREFWETPKVCFLFIRESRADLLLQVDATPCPICPSALRVSRNGSHAPPGRLLLRQPQRYPSHSTSPFFHSLDRERVA